MLTCQDAHRNGLKKEGVLFIFMELGIRDEGMWGSPWVLASVCFRLFLPWQFWRLTFICIFYIGWQIQIVLWQRCRDQGRKQLQDETILWTGSRTFPNIPRRLSVVSPWPELWHMGSPPLAAREVGIYSYLAGAFCQAVSLKGSCWRARRG